MKQKRCIRTMGMALLAGVSLTWGIGQAYAQTGKSRDIERVKEKMKHRVTQEQRKAAAQRLTEARTNSVSPTLQAVSPAQQGGFPDYLGVSNWANSPSPQFDASGNHIPGTGIRKFVDTLPGLGADHASSTLGTYISVGVPDQATYADGDYYEIGLVEYSMKMHTDLPPTRLRGYVQLNDPANPVTRDGTGKIIAWPTPRYLGPVIVCQKDRPVRIKFTNLLPSGSGGDLFIPVDETIMGSGMGPHMAMPMMAEPTMDMMDDPKLVQFMTMEPHNLVADAPILIEGFVPEAYNGQYRVAQVIDNMHFTVLLKTDPAGPATTMGHVMERFTHNRATLHLHGGKTPWISDGTPHQWTTPAGEPTGYPDGVSVKNVPDMPDPGDGSITFFYSNQQSARLMFYHDHAWGITRLNVYVGEAAGYLLVDQAEEQLINDGIIPSLPGVYRYGIPLIIQDKSFVDAGTVLTTDPTWNWGTGTPNAQGIRPPVTGDLWYPHVYVPAQNPYDVSGVNPWGRWAYGPWFWPPTDVPFGPVPNPYCLPTPPAPGSYPDGTYDNSAAPWQPPYVPGAPAPSMPGESFLDVPVVNGAAYPTVTVDPKAYRFRILNGANDRFWNLQLYVASTIVKDIQVTNGGSGYETEPIVTITPAAGDTTGRGATATATVDPATGSITAITLDTVGSGYTAAPTITISAPDSPTGTVATATAILHTEPTEVGMLPAAPGIPGFPADWPRDGRAGGVPDPRTRGPEWIQIGTEGGFLPKPAIIPVQPVVWNNDPTTFNAGNVSGHSLLLGCAERADVIVDFSRFAGRTLIVYNDAPAAFPALDARYDYYTCAPDLSDTGGHTGPKAGFGPNTRTIMQIRVNGIPAEGLPLAGITVTNPGSGYVNPVVEITDPTGTGASATATVDTTTGAITGITLNSAGSGYTSPTITISGAPGIDATATASLAAPAAYAMGPLNAAFDSTDGTDGVFKTSQDPIIVGQSAYDSTYNTTFPSTWPNWGVVRIQDSSAKFMTPAGTLVQYDLQPKAIQDEMGEVYDEFGRMSGKLGLEMARTTAQIQTFTLQNYVDPVTEVLDDCVVTGVATGSDGTQLWKITHNGVDTHPIHFHLFDVQLINRVGWDGAIRLPDENELGWKETVRVSPLEDTIVALRPISPKTPFGQPDSVRLLNPMMPEGDPSMFTNIDPFTGQPIVPPGVNRVVNFGHEYVWHCHILSHEEMDMMRPMKFNVARALPVAPVLSVLGPTVATLTWTDATPPTPAYPSAGNTWGDPNSEIGFRIERSDNNGPFTTIATPTANTTFYTDATINPLMGYKYRVIAYNAAGETVSNTASLSVPVVEVIVDNLDPGASSVGTWVASSNPGVWATNSMYSNTAGSSYSFTAGLSPEATYAVFAWWNAASNRSTAVPYQIRSGDALLGTVTVNQRLNGSQWNLLGIYKFADLARVTVVQSGGITIADAVRFLPVTLQSLEITGPLMVDENTTAQYAASAHYSGGVTATVQPQTWGVDVPQATINASGLLSAGTVDADTPATISAGYTADGVTVNNTLAITVRNTAPAAVEVIVDNLSAGVASTGTWTPSTSAGFYGTNSVFSNTAGSTFTFNASLAPGTTYAVYAWWTAATNRSTAVPYQIRNGAALLETVSVNQRLNGGQWNLLGTYTFTGPASITVVQSGGVTIADAVRFLPVLTPPEIIVDNLSPLTSSTGTWTTTTTAGFWGTNSAYSNTAGSTFTFNPQTTAGTTYAVYAWWTAATNRSTAVPYQIRNGATLLGTVTVNQRLNGGQWNLLGTYTFTSPASITVVQSGGVTIADAVRLVAQ